MPMRTIFLLDIDCFFASVEMATRPELRGKPVCIGGQRNDRGIVACPNYEARAYGVRTAMPLRTAAALLPPHAVFLPGNHSLYAEYSERVMDILYDFTPDIEQVSVDEAYMDVTGCLHFWKGSASCMALAIKERMQQQCGLSVSIGVASNRVCAKIAASLKKPDGLVVVPHGKEQKFLAPLPIEVVPGVGVKTLPKLHAQGIFTVSDVFSRPLDQQSWIGRYLMGVAAGKETQRMQYNRVEKSISRDTTFSQDTCDRDLILSTLYYLTERCCKTLRRRQHRATTVTAKVRFADFTTVQKQTTLPASSDHEDDIFASAQQLVQLLLPDKQFIRLVGVKVSNLSDTSSQQLELDGGKAEKIDRLYKRIDALQEKHGYTTIRWGITQHLHKSFASDARGYRLHSPVYEL